MMYEVTYQVRNMITGIMEKETTVVQNIIQLSETATYAKHGYIVLISAIKRG